LSADDVGDSGEEGATRGAEFDQRGAYLTFDALEKAVIHAVASEELDVAAEYADQLLLLADQLDEYHEEYRAESERLAERDSDINHEEEALEVSMDIVAEWSIENDHPVAEWFEGGASA
jgi:chemotaxis response regulator CheB